MKIEINVNADDIATYMNNDKWLCKYKDEHRCDSRPPSGEFVEKLRENLKLESSYGTTLFELIKQIITE